MWIEICGQERTKLAIVNGQLTAQRYIDGTPRPTAATWCELLAPQRQTPYSSNRSKPP